MNRILALPVVTLAAAALAVAGCSSSGSTAQSTSTKTAASSSTSAHNAADVAFATDMVPHHTQAVEMADLAATRASNAGVKSLAATIKKDQQPEITEMNAWLKAWGQPMASSSSSGAMGGMSSTSSSMGGMSMSGSTGMMSAADMASLGKATGAAFDRMWVTMMITHHQGAVSMAKTELSSGSNAAAKALARSIVTSQTAQIAQLRTLLTKLPAA